MLVLRWHLRSFTVIKEDCKTYFSDFTAVHWNDSEVDGKSDTENESSHIKLLQAFRTRY